MSNSPDESQSECSSPASTSENTHCPSKLNIDPVVVRVLTRPNGPLINSGNNNTGIDFKDKNGNVLSYVNGKSERMGSLNSAKLKPGMSLLADISRHCTEHCQLKGKQVDQLSFHTSNTSEGNRVMCPNLPEQQKVLKPNTKLSSGYPVLRQQLDRIIQHPSMSRTGLPTPVRRIKSEGHVMSNSSALNSTCQSPVAEVYSDATLNDKIWSKLEPTSHRDSMSSSSSKSSNDTVIDLSLPNLAQKDLLDLDIEDGNFESLHLKNSMRPRSATTFVREKSLGVTKSKSNPNLRSENQEIDELCPRPLARGPEESLPPMPRRNTWNRLYVESLKKTTEKRSSDIKSPANQSMSKSLGDLTSDDISCNFESKYRSISRSFISRSMRTQRKPTSMKASARSTDSLTEQLKKLTSFQKENDITSPTEFEPAQCEDDGMSLLRRTSSRSQSRVRYIANRAKQAQERQRLQNICRQNGNSIEERGIPEGACAITKGIYSDSLLPTQFTSESSNRFRP